MAWESHSADQEDEQDNVGENGSEVYNLGIERKNKVKKGLEKDYNFLFLS